MHDDVLSIQRIVLTMIYIFKENYAISGLSLQYCYNCDVRRLDGLRLSYFDAMGFLRKCVGLSSQVLAHGDGGLGYLSCLRENFLPSFGRNAILGANVDWLIHFLRRDLP